MGNFDLIHWDAPLPSPHDETIRRGVNPFQTKSIAYWADYDWSGYAWTLTVSKDGVLLDPNDKQLEWSGTLNFYGDGDYVGWCEFDAQVKDGRILEVSIVELPDDLALVRLPTEEDFAHRERLGKLPKGAILLATEPVRTDQGPRGIDARDYPQGSRFTVEGAYPTAIYARDEQGRPGLFIDKITWDKLDVAKP